MTVDTCLYTVTCRSEIGSKLLREYVHEIDINSDEESAVIKDETAIGSDSTYKVEFTIQITADAYEIPVIEEGMAQLENIEVESCEILS